PPNGKGGRPRGGPREGASGPRSRTLTGFGNARGGASSLRPRAIARAARERVTGNVGVDGSDDRARPGQSGEEPIEEVHLGRAGLSGGAEVAGVASLLRMELVMAECVDGALGDDERAIIRP